MNGTEATGHFHSPQGDFALGHDTLVTVVGGPDTVLIVPLIVRAQADHLKMAGGPCAEAAVSPRLNEPYAPPGTIPGRIRSVTLFYPISAWKKLRAELDADCILSMANSVAVLAVVARIAGAPE